MASREIENRLCAAFWTRRQLKKITLSEPAGPRYIFLKTPFQAPKIHSQVPVRKPEG